MTTKAEIREEFALLCELEGLLLQGIGTASRLGIALEREQIMDDVASLHQKVRFEREIQQTASALGHGEEEK